MKLTAVLAASIATLASATSQYDAARSDPHAWMPAFSNDFRGPCPMLNTLSNHGFLPRDGRNFTLENMIKGLGDGLSFNAPLSTRMWQQAVTVNPEPNATFFTLEQLSVHNVLEHDASLTRTDAAFGSNILFNETIYNATRQWWTEETVTAEMLAHSKIYRQLQSRATNSNYTFSALAEEFSLGEVSAPIVAFGDLQLGTVNRTLMDYFFKNERFPNELGWTKKAEEMTMDKIMAAQNLIRNATSLLTDGGAAEGSSPAKRDLHGGMF